MARCHWCTFWLNQNGVVDWSLAGIGRWDWCGWGLEKRPICGDGRQGKERVSGYRSVVVSYLEYILVVLHFLVWGARVIDNGRRGVCDGGIQYTTVENNKSSPVTDKRKGRW